MKSNATPRPGLAAAPAQQPELLDLPLELIEQIAIRIRDVDSMLSFAWTCAQFAAVSRTPTFVEALTDTLVERSRVRIASRDGVETRASGIYDLARKIGGRMKPRHLNRLVGLLSPKNQAERAHEIALNLEFEMYEQAQSTTQVDAPFNPERFAVSRATRVFKNRLAVLSAALLAGQINGFNAELKDEAEKILWTVWKSPTDVTDALVYILKEPISASEPTLAGHAALGIWLFLEKSLSADNNHRLRSYASSMLSWCASKPVAAKIDVMERIVEWSATCSTIQSKKLGERDDEQDDALAGITPELIRQMVYFDDYLEYLDRLDTSAESTETLNPELAQRFFYPARYCSYGLS
jgi:hypothetical protein